MSPRVRVIRFARAEECRPGSPAGLLVARVIVDENSAPCGAIFRAADGWSHVLPGGVASGLKSLVSRADIERQIILWHLGALPGGVRSPDELKLAM